MSNKAVIGIVATRPQAQGIVEGLKAAGFAYDEISALMPDTHGTRDFAHEERTKAPEGAVAGVSAGGALGGTLGLLVGIGALAIPGLGPLIAAGPLMAALSGAAVGAAVGGVTGGLIGMGIPEVEAKLYEGKIRDGNILMAVVVEGDDEATRAKEVFQRHGSSDVNTVGLAAAPDGGKRRKTIPTPPPSAPVL